MCWPGGGGGNTHTHETSRFNAPYHHVRVSVTLAEAAVECIRLGGGSVDKFKVTRTSAPPEPASTQ